MNETLGWAVLGLHALYKLSSSIIKTYCVLEVELEIILNNLLKNDFCLPFNP